MANRQAVRLPSLVHAQDRGASAAESRLTAMSAMASTLVHELSQPITASQNYLQATAYRLRSQIQGLEAMLDVLDHASAQTRKAGEIIGRMRDFMVSGTITGQRQDLGELVASACMMLRLDAPVEIVRALDPDALDVIADRVQIGQVLSNLLANAVDALSGSDTRRITISSRAAGRMVEVRVADTGPGFGEGEIAQLFEPFYTTKPAGTGLGLPLCRMIVEAHGGRIWAERGGEGATIAFTLRAADAEG
ncbi:ATP-binding protein [Sphingomonas sp. LB-2]|uniref:sensor histidine kinase n=1 Tax=Sphingomonas caeni TaxID=2984949 RepID=UPI00223007E3|nr:ATP-binding protein [Sphingomonas caeni]MCW3848779.1 ATP-binding protein [Sphingomonas caeni]